MDYSMKDRSINSIHAAGKNAHYVVLNKKTFLFFCLFLRYYLFIYLFL